MTYLGYQTRHLADDTEKLQQWIADRLDQPIRVWFVPVIGAGCDQGIVKGRNLLDVLDIEGEEIKDFSDNGQECTFFVGTDYFYSLEVGEFPTDKWGNPATYFDGVSLADGYYEVAYEDDSYFDHKFPIEWEIEDAEVMDFLETVEAIKPELLSSVGEKLVCNGCHSEWRYYTTCKPFTDPDWQQVFDYYVHNQRYEG